MRAPLALAILLVLSPAARAQDNIPRDPIQMEQERRIQGWGFEQSTRQNPQLYPFAPSAPVVPQPAPPHPSVAPLAQPPAAPIAPDPYLTTRHRPPTRERTQKAPPPPKPRPQNSDQAPRTVPEDEVHP
jgi:hypothetical protein